MDNIPNELIARLDDNARQALQEVWNYNQAIMVGEVVRRFPEVPPQRPEPSGSPRPTVVLGDEIRPPVGLAAPAAPAANVEPGRREPRSLKNHPLNPSQR